MTTKILYKYERAPGKFTISPRRPLCEYTQMTRLIADENKLLTNDGGETVFYCADVESADGWVEIDAPQESSETTD